MESLTAPCALVVDDDALILMLASDILADAGFQCYEADNGDGAIALLKKHANAVTLLFSDVEMPGCTNGFALARHVAKEWPHIEIVIASGQVVPRSGDMPERATFISKPFDGEIVHAHLHKKTSRQQKAGSVKVSAVIKKM